MGRGAPMTVIKGGFALGLALDILSTDAPGYGMYFTSYIRLSGLATSSTGFSYKVLGRDGLGDYNSSGQFTEITAPAEVSAGSDYDGFVRITSVPGDYFYKGYSPDELRRVEETAHSYWGGLGTVIAPDIRIVLYGKLDSLSVKQIVRAGCVDGEIATGPTWFYKYKHEWPDGTINGWYASEVHIFDNPQLRGHVSAGSAKLFWDC